MSVAAFAPGAVPFARRMPAKSVRTSAAAVGDS